MRYSKQRERIYAAVNGSGLHPTAIMVYNDLAKDDPRLSLGTVYRNLNQLSDAGRLKKIPLADGSCRYDATLGLHSHIVCTRCGRVADVPLPELAELEKAIERDTGYRLDRYDVVMQGACKDCLERNDPKTI